MASTTYSTDNDDYTIIQYMIVGFTSQLRGWWENMLTDVHRQHIMTNINELGQQNVVHKLIYAMTKTFYRRSHNSSRKKFGNPTKFKI